MHNKILKIIFHIQTFGPTKFGDSSYFEAAKRILYSMTGYTDKELSTIVWT